MISCNNRGLKSRSKFPQEDVGVVCKVSCDKAISRELAGHGTGKRDHGHGRGQEFG